MLNLKLFSGRHISDKFYVCKYHNASCALVICTFPFTFKEIRIIRFNYNTISQREHDFKSTAVFIRLIKSGWSTSFIFLILLLKVKFKFRVDFFKMKHFFSITRKTNMEKLCKKAGKKVTMGESLENLCCWVNVFSSTED